MNGKDDMEDDDDDWLQTHGLTFGVNGHKVQQRVTAMMQVSNCDVRFQLDSGADVNTINQRFVRKEQVRKTNEKLVIWNGTKMTKNGIVRLPTTNLKTGNTGDVDFVVVENGLTCLIGSATTQAMGLMTVHEERFISQVSQSIDIGHLGIAKLKTNPSDQPKILPRRRLPNALQQPVKAELDILVKQGVLVTVGCT